MSRIIRLILLLGSITLVMVSIQALAADQSGKNKDKGKNKTESQKPSVGKIEKEDLPADPRAVQVKGYAGKKYPAEWKEHPALVPGYKVVQLTSDYNEDSKFYLTTESYFPDMNAIAFVSNRTGIWNIFYCDMATGEITQVTDFPKMEKDGHNNICSNKTNEIFYVDKQTESIRKVNLQTLEDTHFYKLPDGYKLGNSMTANADGSVIVLTLIKGAKGKVESSKIVCLNVKDGSLFAQMHRDDQQISHALLTTTGPIPGFFYARKEIADSKYFYFTSLDGKIDTVIIAAKGKGEGVSHPFWTPDGAKACYLRKVRGIERGFWFGYHDMILNKNFEFDKPQDVDMSANYNSTIFVGTGTKEDPCLRFWRVEGEKMVETRMYQHNATFPGPEFRDVHNTFIAGTNNVIFNADGEGNGNVYVLMENKKN